MRSRLLLSAASIVSLLVAIGSVAAQPAKLLISEIGMDGITNETADGGSGEFIEIYNPNSFPVSLDNYYITDRQPYWTFTTAPGNLITIGTTDHILGFPIGTEIPANGVVVVTGRASVFLDDYFSSLLTNFTSQPGNPQLFQARDEPTPGILRMRNFNTDLSEPAQSRVNYTNSSTTNGEFAVLFFWDGNPASNVIDIDMVGWGNPSGGNRFTPRDGVNPVGYLADGGDHSNLTLGTNSTGGFRISAVELGQNTAGGNGINGADESSEIVDPSNPNSSWRTLTTGNPSFFTNGDLQAPNGVTPGVTPLQSTASTRDWNLFH